MTPAERNPDGTFASSDDDDNDPTQETTEELSTQDSSPRADEDPDARDDDGSLIDPPTIPSHERELQEASATGDNDAVAEVQERYTQAREDYVSAARERERGNDQ